MSSIVGRVVSAVGAIASGIGNYTEINPSTLSGAIDIVVIDSGEWVCSPFHVRFGKIKLLRPTEKIVELTVNESVVPFSMKLGEAGEAFFVVESPEGAPSEYATSPIPLPVPSTEVEPFELNPKSPSDILSSSPPEGWQWKWGDLPEKNPYPDSPLRLDSPLPLTPLIPGNSDQRPVSPLPLIPHHLIADGSPRPLSAPLIIEHISPRPSSAPLMADTISLGARPLSNSILGQVSPAVTPSQLEAGMTGDIMTVTEKVDQFLAGLPEDPSIPKIESEMANLSVNASFDQTTEVQTVAESVSLPKFELSRCGPLAEFALLSQEQGELAFSSCLISYESFSTNPKLLSDPLIVVRIDGMYHTWASAAPILLSIAAFGKPPVTEPVAPLPEQSRYWSWWGSTSSKPVPVPSKSIPVPVVKPAGTVSPSKSANARTLSPTRETVPLNDSPKRKHLYAKSLRLNSDQLKSLDLKPGRNSISFSVHTSLQGTATCTANIFLWRSDAKVVISDVDGTITKSDVLGHMFTMVGKDWTHAGVASLYTNIRKNGYVFLYLTSRAIGQASYTREYLQKVEQDRFQLPEGPVIMSPDRLFRALTREVILRKPEEFKIAALRDIKKLFGSKSPFYAGFGNRITDALSYKSVDVPSSRIFTIDPTGEVRLELLTHFKTSYIKLNETVDQMFPPLNKTLDLEYTDFSYWKPDLPDLDLIDVQGTPKSPSKNVAVSTPKGIIYNDSDDEESYQDYEDASGDELEMEGVPPLFEEDKEKVKMKWTESELFRKEEQIIEDMNASPFIG